MLAATTSHPDYPATVALGSYWTSNGTRTLYARRNGSSTYITDAPSNNGTDRTYLVDEIPDLDGQGAVEALIADYLSQARQTRSIPMAHTIVDTAEGRAAA
jgi:hypothetical protein